MGGIAKIGEGIEIGIRDTGRPNDRFIFTQDEASPMILPPFAKGEIICYSKGRPFE